MIENEQLQLLDPSGTLGQGAAETLGTVCGVRCCTVGTVDGYVRSCCSRPVGARARATPEVSEPASGPEVVSPTLRGGVRCVC